MNRRRSTPARTLVIGDLHHRVALAERVIARYRGRFDQVVFVGDYFDSYGDHPEVMRATCRWLTESMQRPNRVHLLGNHDMPYLCPDNPQLICPGWTHEKQAVFSEECADLDRDRLHLAALIGPWLLSHAGFSRRLAAGDSPGHLLEAARRAKVRALAGIGSSLLGRSPARGLPGREEPGVTWLDWTEEFQPVAGLHQIVGHTGSGGTVRGFNLQANGEKSAIEVLQVVQAPDARSLPQPRHGYLSVNWCLDCLEHLVGLIDECGDFSVLSSES